MKSMHVRVVLSEPYLLGEAMKKFLAALILTASMFISGLCYADANITATWDPNTEADLAGYHLFIGTESGNYSDVIDTGLATVGTFATLPDGPYYIAVTAYDTSGNESGYSEEVMVVVDSNAPGDPARPTITVTVQ